MIHIRPVSDLRNKYPEGTKLMQDAKYNEYFENALDEADKEAENPNTKSETHKEVFDKIRRGLND